jgi:hypothetical protein
VFDPVLFELGIFETGECISLPLGFEKTAFAFPGLPIINHELQAWTFAFVVPANLDFWLSHNQGTLPFCCQNTR